MSGVAFPDDPEKGTAFIYKGVQNQLFLPVFFAFLHIQLQSKQPYKCFIRIQLDVQYSVFLEKFLALHVSDVTCVHVSWFWCVYSMGLVLVLGHFVTLARSVSDW
jgi:hypothetical protein